MAAGKGGTAGCHTLNPFLPVAPELGTLMCLEVPFSFAVGRRASKVVTIQQLQASQGGAGPRAKSQHNASHRFEQERRNQDSWGFGHMWPSSVSAHKFIQQTTLWVGLGVGPPSFLLLK